MKCSEGKRREAKDGRRKRRENGTPGRGQRKVTPSQSRHVAKKFSEKPSMFSHVRARVPASRQTEDTKILLNTTVKGDGNNIANAANSRLML